MRPPRHAFGSLPAVVPPCPGRIPGGPRWWRRVLGPDEDVGGQARVAAVKVTPGAATLTALGESRRIRPEARDAQGNEVTGVSFSWSTSEAFVQVGGGGAHTRGVTAAGDPHCRGSNSVGPLGDGTFLLRSAPARVVQREKTGGSGAVSRGRRGSSSARSPAVPPRTETKGPPPSRWRAESGRPDSNRGPPQPHCGALPDCATSRKRPEYNGTSGAGSRRPETRGSAGIMPVLGPLKAVDTPPAHGYTSFP